MPLSLRKTSAGVPKVRTPASPAALRDRIALLTAFAVILGLGAVMVLARDTQFLMPGPLTTAHATIKDCAACHSHSGADKISWLHGLIAGAKSGDNTACLTCHRMPDTALNAHGASKDVLERSTKRLAKIAAATPVPHAVTAQNIVFPTERMVAGGLSCATCHQEHKGSAHNLTTISDAQCGSCHVVKFDSFDGHHPEFSGYPFRRRTRIIYDHAGHFGKHFPEIAKKDPTKRIPETCTTCHDNSRDTRVMTVAPFEKACASCHLDQILGKERLSGPKGVAFLALPGLDLTSLRNRKAEIGEWPEASEGGLTPFMKLLISRHQQGRDVIDVVDKLDLQDLRNATDEQIIAVSSLVWEIKRLYHALIKGKASDVLAGVDGGRGDTPSAAAVADLIASIPLDVISSAQQNWLPELGAEMTRHGEAGDRRQGGWTTAIAASRVSVGDTVAKSGARAQAQEKVNTGSVAGPATAKASAGQPAAQMVAPAGSTSGVELATPGGAPPAKAADQTDDLLFPTEAELRAIKGRTVGRAAPPASGKPPAQTASEPDRAVPPEPSPTLIASASEVRSTATPVAALKSDVEPESWAEHGGWYRQDYTIFYRPTGHKDRFIAAWLRLAGPEAPRTGRSPAAAIFSALAGKDAQGSCAKCHSIDDRQSGRTVNFSPASAEDRKGRFTTFSHGPHMTISGREGCLTCHNLETGRSYLDSYEQGDPDRHVSNFGAVKQEGCRTCHTSGKAPQDCLTCHTYHVHGATSPVMATTIPRQ